MEGLWLSSSLRSVPCYFIIAIKSCGEEWIDKIFWLWGSRCRSLNLDRLRPATWESRNAVYLARDSELHFRPVRILDWIALPYRNRISAFKCMKLRLRYRAKYCSTSPWDQSQLKLMHCQFVSSKTLKKAVINCNDTQKQNEVESFNAKLSWLH